MAGPEVCSGLLTGVGLAGAGLSNQGLLGISEAGWLVGVAGLGVLVILSAIRFMRRQSEEDSSVALPAAPMRRPQAAQIYPSGKSAEGQICTAFGQWLADLDEQTSAWVALDQFIREMLTAHLGGSRVRCFHVDSQADVLCPIAQTGKAGVEGPSVREGVLGHAVTSGREYVASDPGQGPLVHDLATQGGGEWAWVWPVRAGRQTIGLIAVGGMRDAVTRDHDLRQGVGAALSVCWRQVACLEQLRVASRTDQGSGVLTRSEFFAIAGRALEDSYAVNEPVVVAVLALEGLRRLDDEGCWRERDQLVEQVGEVLTECVRSDDLVGRFADDRFAVLLRRLDSGLGRLIAEKMGVRARGCVAALGEAPSTSLGVRVGLAGSGLSHPPLETLLGHAFEAVEQARRSGVDMASDLESTGEHKPNVGMAGAQSEADPGGGE